MSQPAIQLLPVAKVIKSFGVKGEMLIRYSPRFDGDLDTTRPVFIKYDGLPVPFFIKEINPRGTDGALLLLDGITSPLQVEEIAGEFVYLEESGDFTEEEDDYRLLSGFEVKDAGHGILGTVSNYYDYPGNPCLGIKRLTEGLPELLIPVHPSIILQIDPGRKQIKTRIPNGLLAL